MASPSDRTYLASLGFSDPDKKLPLHDLGCRFLAQPEMLRGLFDKFNTRNLDVGESAKLIDHFVGAHVEAPLTKGQNQYKTVIGYADVIAHFGSNVITYDISDVARSKGYQIVTNQQSWLMEVKITRETVGNIIRQLNTYRLYLHFPHTFVATIFDLSEDETAMLAGANIIHLKLGPKFEQFVEKQKQTPASSKNVL